MVLHHRSYLVCRVQGGFGANADELDTASKLLQDYQINPKQSVFIDELAPILELNNLETDLVFIPLRETYKSTEAVEDEPTDDTVDDEEGEDVQLSEHLNADDLIEMGEDVDYNEWELIDDRQIEVPTLLESHLNTIFQFRTADIPKVDGQKSDQDTSLFRIRYRYAGNPLPERDFCRRVVTANKVYKVEDLLLAEKRVVNSGFGIGGKDKYSIFKYKGGVNCKHWWQRVIFLKKGNNKISVNQARKMILELEPSQRKEAKWDKNPKEVAVIASPSNNFWKVN